MQACVLVQLGSDVGYDADKGAGLVSSAGSVGGLHSRFKNYCCCRLGCRFSLILPG